MPRLPGLFFDQGLTCPPLLLVVLLGPLGVSGRTVTSFYILASVGALLCGSLHLLPPRSASTSSILLVSPRTAISCMWLL